MFNKLLKKLHSRSGASLTFALLLFMVCAAVGSVVLASATAAAGRASETAEYDRRYFAVTSAVDLLRGTLDAEEQTFTFEITKRSYRWESVTTTVNSGGALVGTPIYDGADYDETDAVYGAKYEPRLLRADGTPVDLTTAVPADLLGMAMSSLVKDKDAAELFDAPLYDATGAVDWITPASDNDLPGEMTLTVTPSGAASELAELTATVTPELELRNGLLYLFLDVENAEGDVKYTLRLTMSANVNVYDNFDRDSDVRYSTLPPEVITNSGNTTTTITSIYETSRTRSVAVSWRTVSVGKAAD